MADLNVVTPLAANSVSLERQHLALALRAVAAAARGQVEVAEKAVQTLSARAALLAAPSPRASFLRLVHWR